MKSFASMLGAAVIAATTIITVPACTTSGVGGPSVTLPATAREREVAIVAAVTTARNTTASLLKAGKISAADAQSVNDQGDAIVKLAQAIAAAPVTGANVDPNLTQALALLNALQTYLASKG